MRQRQPNHFEQIAFSQKIKHFLSNFKVHPCQNPYPHHSQYCNQYHSHDDRRRNPYKEYNFLYYPIQNCSCQQDDCQNCHNMYEYYYHPLLYKTSKCQNYPCELGLICSYLHDQQMEMLMRYQFFRFELDAFKTELCPNRQQPSNIHQLASCRFYHNQSDRRRNPRKVCYSHVQCARNHCNDPNCSFAHNKIQQLYHPSRYKTKYCQSFINKRVCQYNQYCSFAHSNNQIKIELLHQIPRNQSFYDYKYKTVWCPYTNQHDRANCPYAHNFQDYRRDPKKKIYTPQICPSWTKGQIKSIEDSGCPLRMDCPKSHGWLEKKYHPELKRWEAGQTQTVQAQIPEKCETVKVPEKKKSDNDQHFGVGAPFFKRQQKTQRSQSQTKIGHVKPKQKSKSKQTKSQRQKWFNFSFFLPDQQTWTAQNDQNDFQKFDVEACWGQQHGQHKMDKEEIHSGPDSPLKKSKISKKHKAQYTKSFQQLLGTNGLYEKVSASKVNQIKLLSLSQQDLDKFGMNNQQKDQLMSIIKEYSKTHKLDKVKYTDSMVKIFRSKALLQTLQKLKTRGVTQSVLQVLSNSTIEDLSFLQEEQKSSLPKILEEYADDRAFRQLNTLIEKQAYLKVIKPKRVQGRQNFKT